MQFEQVIVLLFDQGVDASKASKSFQNRTDLFVIVSKLIEISESAFTIEDGFAPQNRSKRVSEGSKMTLGRSEPEC